MAKLKQIVCDKTELTLTKEKKAIGYGEEFEIKDEARVKEILAATFQGKPVAELVEEPEEDKEVKTTKKVSKKK